MTTRVSADVEIPPRGVSEVLPHRGTMLLIDAIERCTASEIAVRATARRDWWYANADGAMPAWIGIELMAQAIAAHAGLVALHAGSVARPGVLLGTSGYGAHSAAFEPGTVLTITARELLRGADGQGAYDCAIHAGERCAAQAVVKVYQPDDFQSFIERSIHS